MARKTTRKPYEPLESGIAEAEAIDAPAVLTVNGKPIDPAFAHAINYAMTDQGIAEAKARAEAGPKPSGVTVGDGPFEKALQRKAEAQVWDSFDPLKEAVDQVRQPGMTYRFLDDKVLKRRGRRGWEPVLDKDGKPVEVAGMRLGAMPAEYADKRNAHYREIGNEQLANAAERYQEDQAKLIRDAGVKGMSPLRIGETLSDNFAHPGMRSQVGVHATRGAIGEAAGE
jgi:hypothetical protein